MVGFSVVMLRVSRSRARGMSHRGRSEQLCPENEMGETDSGGDRAAAPLRGKKIDTRSGLKIDSILSVFLENGYFTRKRNDGLRSGSVYPSCHTNLVKRNQGKNVVLFRGTCVLVPW